MFMTGRTIYENFVNGVGPDGLSASAEMVRQVAEEYDDEGTAIRQLTARMEAIWQGDAAGAASRGAGPLVAEHDAAGSHMLTAQDLNGRQAGSFGDARNSVVPVPPEPTAPDPWSTFNLPGEAATFRDQVTDYNAANQRNVDVMRGYGDAAVYNTTNMPLSYGALSGDQAGIVVDSGVSGTDGSRGAGSASIDGPRGGGSGVVERATNGAHTAGSPSDTGGLAGGDGSVGPGGASTDGRQPVPQETTPGGFTPTPSAPPGQIPVGLGGGGSGTAPSPAGGSAPFTGFGPLGGGGLGAGPDGRGPGSGPGGRGPGVPGSGGRGTGAPGSGGLGGRAGGGEPHGPGGRPGPGSPAGTVAGGPRTSVRGGGMSGMPMGAGGRGRGEDDLERRSPSYLREDDPESVFGTDEMTAPPVIGEDESFEKPNAG